MRNKTNLMTSVSGHRHRVDTTNTYHTRVTVSPTFYFRPLYPSFVRNRKSTSLPSWKYLVSHVFEIVQETQYELYINRFQIILMIIEQL